MSSDLATSYQDLDYCRACNNPYAQDQYPIYQYQSQLVFNGGITMDYYVETNPSKVNFLENYNG